jgi:L-lactate dehydrogenase complex protein LldG
MMVAREQFLTRVRNAVAAQTRPGEGSDPPVRGTVGYQGDGGVPLECFCEQLTSAAGEAHCVRDENEACNTIIGLVQHYAARRVLLDDCGFINQLGLQPALTSRGVEVRLIKELAAGSERDSFFAADLGITGVTALIAETGTLVLCCRPDEPRSVSLLPPVHIALARRSQIVADLFDLFEARQKEVMPACMTLITGPSKTGDIELQLVTGVHGPGRLHVVLLAD